MGNVGYRHVRFLGCNYLVVFHHPFEKNAQVKLDHFPRDRVEHTKYLKPPPRQRISEAAMISHTAQGLPLFHTFSTVGGVWACWYFNYFLLKTNTSLV